MTRFLPGLVLALAACTTPASVTPISQSQPVAATYTCRHQAADGTWEPVPLADCAPGAADHRLLAWVANGFTGDVGIIDLTRGKPVDLDVQVPGHTRVRLGVTLSDVTALPTGDVIFATDPVERTLVGMDSLTLEKTVTFDLPGAPLRVLTLPWADPLLWVLVDDPPALVPVDPAEGPLEALALPGSPSDAASAEGSTRLVVAYQRLHRISVVDLSTLTLLPDIGLADACADGLDNDDDGLADAADPHCEGPGDDREAPDDPAPAPTACLDGLDNDDDGLTDVADPGCVGLLDGSEAEDAPAGAPPEGYLPAWELPCADSLDDDGDG
ncbi:MAG: hypothetical protein FJ098_15045, partial [Deltaproteobacteria bacterium]|nr:hypothetical protein [Deltaproteobacteria bacterium]